MDKLFLIHESSKYLDSVDRLDEAYAVHNAGYSVINEKSYTSFRKLGRPDYQLIYLHAGEMKIFTNGKTQILSAGSIVLYPPNRQQHYAHSCNPENVNYWVHFSGKEIPSLLKRLKLDGTFIAQIGKNNLLVGLFEELIERLKKEDIGSSTMSVASLLQILSTVANAVNGTPNVNERQLNKIAPALAYIRQNYQIDQPVSFYAKLCLTSVSNFAHLFTLTMERSPKNYVLEKRLDAAKYLLRNTDYSVKDVALSVGFDNPLYFSRIFKKRFGQPPSEYQKKRNDIFKK